MFSVAVAWIQLWIVAAFMVILFIGVLYLIRHAHTDGAPKMYYKGGPHPNRFFQEGDTKGVCPLCKQTRGLATYYEYEGLTLVMCEPSLYCMDCAAIALDDFSTG